MGAIERRMIVSGGIQAVVLLPGLALSILGIYFLGAEQYSVWAVTFALSSAAIVLDGGAAFVGQIARAEQSLSRRQLLRLLGLAALAPCLLTVGLVVLWRPIVTGLLDVTEVPSLAFPIILGIGTVLRSWQGLSNGVLIGAGKERTRFTAAAASAAAYLPALGALALTRSLETLALAYAFGSLVGCAVAAPHLGPLTSVNAAHKPIDAGRRGLIGGLSVTLTQLDRLLVASVSDAVGVAAYDLAARVVTTAKLACAMLAINLVSEGARLRLSLDVRSSVRQLLRAQRLVDRLVLVTFAASLPAIALVTSLTQPELRGEAVAAGAGLAVAHGIHGSTAPVTTVLSGLRQLGPELRYLSVALVLALAIGIPLGKEVGAVGVAAALVPALGSTSIWIRRFGWRVIRNTDMRERRKQFRGFGPTAPIVTVALGASAGIGYLLVVTDPLVWLALALLTGLCIAASAAPAGVAFGFAPVMLVPVPAMLNDRIGPFPLGPTVVAATLLFAALLVARTRPTVRVPRSVLAAYLVLVGSGFLGAVAFKPAALPQTVMVAAVWAVGLLLGLVLAERPDRLRYLIPGLLAIIVVIFADSITGQNLWEAVTGPSRLSQGSQLVRARATLGHPLVAGAVLVIFAMLVLASQRRLPTPIAALALVAALLTVSRSAILGALVGIISLLFVSPGSRRRALFVTALGAVAAVGVTLAPQLESFRETFNERAVLGQTADATRASALRIFADDVASRPLSLALGQGFGASGSRLREQGGLSGINTFDNQYITLAYDAGLFALLAAVLLLVLAIVRAERERRVFAVPLIAAAAMFLVFEGLYWYSTGVLFWTLVALGAAEPRSRFRARSALASRDS